MMAVERVLREEIVFRDECSEDESMQYHSR